MSGEDSDRSQVSQARGPREGERADPRRGGTEFYQDKSLPKCQNLMKMTGMVFKKERTQERNEQETTSTTFGNGKTEVQEVGRVGSGETDA